MSPEEWGRKVAALVKTHVALKVGPLLARIAALEAAQSKTLADHFEGGWLAGRVYKRGALVQRGDSLHLCLTETDEAPGSSAAWRCLFNGSNRR